jgi:zinc transporter, ZIP family
LSFAETVGLGALAGSTIFIGLPAGRLQLLGTRTRVGLAMFSVGILAFIFVDVLSSGLTIVHTALDHVKHHTGSVGYLILLVVLLGGGFLVGSSGLAALERRLRPHNPPIAGGSGAAAATAAEAELLANELDVARRRTLRVCLTIAGAVGVHNFGEGLAIGVSARAGAISLATVLIIGFALHNATEGFGIVGPLGGVRPDRRRPHLPGDARRILGDQPSARARVLRRGCWGDHLRDRRDLEWDAPLRPQRARPADAERRFPARRGH